MSPRHLILASASPRRRELLSLLGVPFEVVPSGSEEAVPPGVTPPDLALHLAEEKAREVAGGVGGALVLGADTVVALPGGEMLAKPADEKDARRMLRTLSGATHSVYTGLCLIDSAHTEIPDSEEQSRTGCRGRAPSRPVRARAAATVVATDVAFRPLTEEEIDAYVGTGEPMDKAGAYGIQGGAAGFIEYIRGDYYNVVGFPLAAVRNLLLPYYPHLPPVPPPPPLPFPVYAW